MRLRYLLTAVVLVVALVAALGGCSEEQRARPIIPGPGPSKVEVDTPELREIKAGFGMEDCQPGPGGGALPAITLECLGGGTSVSLDTLRGPMIISLWFAGCEPCKEEMPALQAFHDHFGDRVPVLGIDFQDQYPASALEEAGSRGVTFPSLADPGGDIRDSLEFAKIPGLPAMYFVDEAGAITHAHFGGLNAEQQIIDLVAEHLGVTLEKA